VKPRHLEWIWSGGIWLAAGLLFTVNLGKVPLRDWDEGIVAQVARDIWRSPLQNLTWLYPTIAGSPYFNKPPLVHWLMALTYQVGGVNEWTARLPGALLTTTSVLLLYWIGLELFPKRVPAVLAALVYLTLLPVVRHGRLAMLDGAILCFWLLLVLCLLRSRRDLRWSLGVGIGLGLLSMTKGLIAVLLGAIAALFILWDTPRLLSSPFLWSGLVLGIAPAAAWYWAQWLRYGSSFFSINLVNQSLNRIWSTVEQRRSPPWYYLLEIIKYSAPWLLFLPAGLRLAWENRLLSWAKLTLVWLVGFLLAISLMSTKLPWYVLPIYPACSLVVGAWLADCWDPADSIGPRTLPHWPLSSAWTGSFGILAIASAGASIYFSPLGGYPDASLLATLLGLTLTLAAVTVLLTMQDAQFVPVLIWGCYITLMLLMLSPHWVWELGEDYPVKPVAALIQRHVPIGTSVATSHPVYRPSLDFYSDRVVKPLPPDALQSYWQQTPQPYLLLPSTQSTQFVPHQALGTAQGWVLITRIPL
jgi:4-amino-4-deoxy-L-arabinose transferase-like glycosyltransferase